MQLKSAEVARKHRPDYLILLFMGITMLIGLVMIYAIGHQRANVLNNIFGTDYSENYFFINQLISITLSLVMFFAAFKMPIKYIQKLAKYVLIVGILACIVLAIGGALGLGFAQCTYGACRWYSIGGKSLQPAEILKLGMLLYLALFLATRFKHGVINKSETLVPLAVLSGLALFLVVVLQKDLGTGVVIGLMVLCMLLIAGMSKKLLLVILAGAIVLGAISTVATPHRRERLATFLSGDSSTVDDDEAYHVTNAKIAIGTGGLLGVGIGNSVQATGYLPESINDSIFAIMGETFGFVGIVIVILLFMALLSRLLRTVYFLHSDVGRILVAGVFGWIAAHTLMNIAAMIGLMPLTGITLPFLSYGGTSMLFIATALGLVFNLSRYTAHTPVEEGGSDEDSSGRRRLGRTRHASRGSNR